MLTRQDFANGYVEQHGYGTVTICMPSPSCPYYEVRTRGLRVTRRLVKEARSIARALVNGNR